MVTQFDPDQADSGGRIAARSTPTALETPFSIDPQSEVPVSLQLAWRLRTLITSGRIAPDQAMPSVRMMAEWAGVNVNTVRAVYAALEDQGLVVTRHGAGTFVTGAVPASPEIERIAAGALEEASTAGLDPREVAIAAMALADLAGFDVDQLEGGARPRTSDGPPGTEERTQPGDSPAAMPDPGLDPNQLATRQTLREQIARLEGQLAGVWHELDPEERPPLRRGVPHVASVAELEEIRDRLLEQLERSRGAAMDRAKGQQVARERRDAMLADPAAHPFERVSADEVGEPGCAEWSVEPRYGPLGALMRWWQVKVSGGCPLPAPLAAASETDRQWSEP